MQFDIPLSVMANLLTFIFYSAVVRRFTSFSLIVIGVFLLEVYGQIITHTLSGIQITGFNWVWPLWFLGFALTDFLFVGATIWLVNHYHLQWQWVSRVVLSAHVVMGVIQCSVYLSYLTVDSWLIDLLYTDGIVLINLFTSTLMLGYVIYITAEYFHNRAWTEHEL